MTSRALHTTDYSSCGTPADHTGLGIPVFLKRIDIPDATISDTERSCPSPELLERETDDLLNRLNIGNLHGRNILVKPNLVKPGDPLSVTSPEMILALCKILRDYGAQITVADSPAFGTARIVLKKLGILEMLDGMGIDLKPHSRPVPVRLPCGITAGVSEYALETDLIINLPRLKAHCQMVLTCAMKNLFGTVSGFRKAWYHTKYGHDMELFCDMIIDLNEILPKTVTVLDAVVAMHVTGPAGGDPFPMGLLAGCADAIAIDRAACEIIGIGPEMVPLLRQAQKRHGPSASTDLTNLIFPLLKPSDFPEARNFILPEELKPLTFSPLRLIHGRLRSLLKKIFQ